MSDAQVVFGAWVALDDDAVPDAPAAVQVRRRDGLVVYPRGKSAMVYYFYAATSARTTLRDAFADELARPGARGQGPLLARWTTHDAAHAALADLYARFVERFGGPPVLHGEDAPDDDAP